MDDCWIIECEINACVSSVLRFQTVVLSRKDPRRFVLCLCRVLPQGLSVHLNHLTTVQDWSLFQEHSSNVKVMPNQRPWWSSGYISMKTFILEDSRLLFLWRISSWMLPLKSLPVGNRMLINQRWWIFTGSFFYVDSRNKPFPQLSRRKKWNRVSKSLLWFSQVTAEYSYLVQFFLNRVYSFLDIVVRLNSLMNDSAVYESTAVNPGIFNN